MSRLHAAGRGNDDEATAEPDGYGDRDGYGYGDRDDHRHSDRDDAVDLAILGVGRIGRVHLESARVTDGVRTVAAADAVAANRDRAREAGVDAVYDDYRTLLSTESPDAVVVALPPSLHAPAVRAAADAGCDAFVEKPFARSVSEGREMLAVADDAGIRLGVDHTIRYLPEVDRVAEALREGRVGHVPFASVSRVNCGPFAPPPPTERVADWALDPEATGGGVLLDLGLHLFDVLEHLFGELTVIAAETDRQLSLPFEDAATVLLRAEESGTVVSMHCGGYQWEAAAEMNFRLRLEGVAGTVDSVDYRPKNLHAHAAKSVAGNVARAVGGGDAAPFAPTYYLRAHYRALADFLDAVAADRDPPVGGERGVRTLELAEAAYAAAENEPGIGPIDRDGDDDHDGHRGRDDYPDRDGHHDDHSDRDAPARTADGGEP
ncbi:Gfo/Idh/MocA family oxidoreductase (plasmid) [Halobaculum sp. CBA1158]|uniref:Gfo/Idh/MocA family protein n=1 Tax=Halobaculum sp. CBA1158 TaxID=2904243 RepID=UPI001F27F6FF|nr:Gfo/Idh/MocA family oxidoreductase [Halobaculum sp. CBA1158]UIP01461.1 Gfo/Idh/MocA family oxidoreductase [Halobaculum sp. CBA1158]